MQITRRDTLKYAAMGALSFSVGGVLARPEYSFAGPLSDSGHILVNGGEFAMGSPSSEFLRESDEAVRRVTVDSFYMGKYAVTQKEYRELMGNNPSEFPRDDAPVENVTWYEAVRYCNAKSAKEGLVPAYSIDGLNVAWNRNANGYRLPTEAEWEYAARAGTVSPFYTGSNITTSQANWYGTYPYGDGASGEARQRTLTVGSFPANPFGLYDMSGNVWEWCWDWYGPYDSAAVVNPSGPTSGVYKVHRGGGWNDFGRHLRSAYRAAYTPANKLYNIGFRVVRNANRNGATVSVTSSPLPLTPKSGGKTLVFYFTWSGNTGMLAKEIHKITGGDLVRLEMANPYSGNYGACLTQSRRDQQQNARPAIKPVNTDGYDVIYLGYPTWWATAPMPVWTFLEQHDLSNTTIVPFASHGEGRLGQTLSAVAKCAPRSIIKEPFSIMYSNLSRREMRAWLDRIFG